MTELETTLFYYLSETSDVRAFLWVTASCCWLLCIEHYAIFRILCERMTSVTTATCGGKYTILYAKYYYLHTNTVEILLQSHLLRARHTTWSRALSNNSVRRKMGFYFIFIITQDSAFSHTWRCHTIYSSGIGNIYSNNIRKKRMMMMIIMMWCGLILDVSNSARFCMSLYLCYVYVRQGEITGCRHFRQQYGLLLWMAMR